MTLVTDLDCTVTLGGVSQSGHIMSCKRTGNLVEADTKFEVVLDGTAAHVTVGASCVIAEMGTTVLTGNVDTVHYARQPEYTITVQGRDNFWLIEDFFIDDPYLQAQGETVAYWVGQLCALAGISYTIPSGDGLQPVGSIDSPVSLGMVLVIDDLRQLCALPGWSMRMTAAGVLEFVVLPDSGAADEIFTQLAGGNRTLSDQQTRNVAKIWGYDADGNALLYQQRVDIPGIRPDRIMVVSTPNIQTLVQAQTLAQKLLDHFANLDEIADMTLPVGLPALRLGMVGQATIEPGHTQRSVVTDLESTIAPSGYQQAISMGRKNFALPYYPPGIIPVPGTLVWEVDTLQADRPNAIAVIGGQLYIGGTQGLNLTDWGIHLEKRSPFDGSLTWLYRPANPSLDYDGDIQDITFDASSIYTCGSTQAGANQGLRKFSPFSPTPILSADGFYGGVSIDQSGGSLWDVRYNQGSPGVNNKTLNKIRPSDFFALSRSSSDGGTNLWVTTRSRIDPTTGNLINAMKYRLDVSVGFSIVNTIGGGVFASQTCFCISAAGRLFSHHSFTRLTEISTDLSSNLWETAVTYGPGFITGTGSANNMAIGPTRLYSAGDSMGISGVNLNTLSEDLAVAGSASPTDQTRCICYDSGYIYTASIRSGTWVVQKRVA